MEENSKLFGKHYVIVIFFPFFSRRMTFAINDNDGDKNNIEIIRRVTTMKTMTGV